MYSRTWSLCHCKERPPTRISSVSLFIHINQNDLLPHDPRRYWPSPIHRTQLLTPSCLGSRGRPQGGVSDGLLAFIGRCGRRPRCPVDGRGLVAQRGAVVVLSAKILQPREWASRATARSLRETSSKQCCSYQWSDDVESAALGGRGAQV